MGVAVVNDCCADGAIIEADSQLRPLLLLNMPAAATSVSVMLDVTEAEPPDQETEHVQVLLKVRIIIKTSTLWGG